MASVQLLLPTGRLWIEVRDGDPRLRQIYNRHYSRRVYRDGRVPKKIVGPGEYMALVTQDLCALFVWRKFFDASGQDGVNCAVFRRETQCPYRASDMIRAAMDLAWLRWPGKRLYTYVNASRIRSVNPGYCFKRAGWRRHGKTKGGLVILEALPEADHDILEAESLSDGWRAARARR